MKKTHLIAPLFLVVALLVTAGFITANTPVDKPAQCSKASDAAQCEKSAPASSCSLEQACEKTKSSCSMTADFGTCPQAKAACTQKCEGCPQAKECSDDCQKECCSK